MEVGLFYEVGFLPDGVHLQKIIYGDADGGVRSVVAEVDVVDFYRGILSLGAQQIYIRPVSYTHLRAPRDTERSRMPSSA